MTARTLLWTGAVTFALATAADAAMTISNAKTRNVSCARHVCTPTGGNANLNAGRLQIMLAASDVTVKSNAAAPNIGILDPLTWASTHRLTLDAYESINVRAPVVVEGTAGVTLITNDGGSGGDYMFNTATSGSIAFWDTTSSLIVNGQTFTLVKDIKTLAGDIAANASGNYALANTYDATADGAYPDAPIPNFSGALEGLGNAIQNLSIATTNQNAVLGLVAFLQAGGTIRDINLSNASISGVGTEHNCFCEALGALVAYSHGTIARVNVSGSVSAGSGRVSIGGIAGSNSGTIVASSFTGKIYNKQKSIHWLLMGGIAGYSSGSVLQSWAIVDVSGGGNVGGLVGESKGIVALSHSSGTVGGAFAGGLVGVVFAGTITQSFSSADVVSQEYGGGLVGEGDTGTQVTQSYAIGAVSGKGRHVAGGELGGFAGINDAMISQAYATGTVSPSDHFCPGGFAGRTSNANNLYSAAYWDMTTTQQQDGTCFDNVDGITGLTDAQLKSTLPAGFDPNVWGQDPSINNGWPYLLANPPQ